jgi:hypothetical protein
MLTCKSKYYRIQLTDVYERQVYDAILSKLELLQNEIVIDPIIFGNDNIDINKIIFFIRLDNPGLFYVDFNNYIFELSFSSLKIVFPFFYPILKIQSLESKLTHTINEILSYINLSKFNSFEKEQYLHDYLTTHVKFEDKDRKYHKSHSIVGAILHGRAVCEGIANAFKLLCDFVGISCIVVCGKILNSESTAGHAWNIVKLNGKCYHVDVTHDVQDDRHNILKYCCFNLTDNDISQDREWDRKLLPQCFEIEDNYFVHNKMFISSSKDLRKFFITSMENEKNNFSFRVNKKFNDCTIIYDTLRDVIQNYFLFSNFCSVKLAYNSLRDIIDINLSIDYSEVNKSE